MHKKVVAAAAAVGVMAAVAAYFKLKPKVGDKTEVVWKHVPVDDDDWRARPVGHYLDMMQHGGVEMVYLNEELDTGKPVLCCFFIGELAVEMAQDLDLVDVDND